jgi:nondiscriminating aspartyl-tRNA synthetase
MNRVLNRDVVKNVGKEVNVQGWLHKKRLLGGLNFIVLRDRSGILQMVIDKSEEVEKLRGMQIGTVLTVSGKAVEESVHLEVLSYMTSCLLLKFQLLTNHLLNWTNHLVISRKI